jgi:hypothetical protein
LAREKPTGTVPARGGASAHRAVRLSVQACRRARGISFNDFGRRSAAERGRQVYLDFFIMAYQIVFERRIAALETEGSKAKTKTRVNKT